MTWNKRLMTFTRERGLEPKRFRSGPPGREGEMTRHTKIERETAEYEIKLDVDFDKIFSKMGGRAARSKSGRCRDGLVLVKAHKKRVISSAIEVVEIPGHWREVTP